MQLKPEMIIDEVEEWSISHYFTPNFSIVLYKFQLLLMDHNQSMEPVEEGRSNMTASFDPILVSIVKL